MQKKVRVFSFSTISLLIITAFIFLPFSNTFAGDSGGIDLEKDVFLGWPIASVEDLPDEVTIALYESETASVPLAAQTFARGGYTLDFELSKSDGVSSGSIARFKVNFTNKLNLGTDTDSPVQPKEIWAEMAVDGSVVGDRSRVSDDTLVQLLLASDASIVTYLTLVYEGDDNPITSIYRTLPLSTVAPDGSGSSLNSYFSAVASDGLRGAADNWVDSGANVYTTGSVGIGTTTIPNKLTVVNNGTTEATTFTNYNSVFFNAGSTYFGFRNTTDDAEGIFGIGGGAGARFGLGSITNLPIEFFVNSGVVMLIDTSGRLGIGTQSPAYNLAVNGTIGCKELTVTNTGWADFVFKDSYKLPSLSEVETFISENKHLPGIPTEAEVAKNGVSVGDMSAKLLQKVEELTLYMIDMKKENESLKAQLSAIQEQLDKTQK